MSRNTLSVLFAALVPFAGGCQDSQNAESQCQDYCGQAVLCGLYPDTQTCQYDCLSNAKVLRPDVFDETMECMRYSSCEEMGQAACPAAARKCTTDYQSLVEASCQVSLACGEISDIAQCYRDAFDELEPFSCYRQELVDAAAKCLEEEVPCTKAGRDQCIAILAGY